jgi:hypothetical protein
VQDVLVDIVDSGMCGIVHEVFSQVSFLFS